MALIIKFGSLQKGTRHLIEWHFGEPIPPEIEHLKVVEFVADSRELEMFIEAISFSHHQ
jgi:hypothetical protein